MKLNSISIKNYRGINELEIQEFGQLNLVLGKNNSYKTTLLESIFLLIGASNPVLSLTVDQLRNIIHNEAEDFRFIFYKLDLNKPINLVGKFSINDHERTLNITPIQNLEKSISKNRNEKSPDTSTYSTSAENNILILKGLNFDFQIKEKHSNREYHESKIIFENKNFDIIPPKKYDEKLRGVFASASSIPDANVYRRLESLIINKKTDFLVETIKLIDPSINNFTLGSNNMIYVDAGFDKLIPLNLIGNGGIRLVSLLLSVSDCENGILLIDEIENGLHFSTLKTLWRAIINASIAYNVQLFISTHNHETIKHLSDVLLEPAFISSQKNIKSFTIRKINENQITAYAYDYDKFHYAIKQEIELR